MGIVDRDLEGRLTSTTRSLPQSPLLLPPPSSPSLHTPAVLQCLGDFSLNSEGFCRPGTFLLPSVCSQTGFCSCKSFSSEFKLFARLEWDLNREGTRGGFMTKPGAENEDLRPHLVTKTSLYNKARVTLAELPDGDSHLPSLGLLSSMARFVNWFGLTSPQLLCVDLILEFKTGYPLLNCPQAM